MDDMSFSKLEKNKVDISQVGNGHKNKASGTIRNTNT